MRYVASVLGFATCVVLSLCAGCGTSGTSHSEHVHVSISGVANGERLVNDKTIIIGATSSVGTITRLVVTGDGGATIVDTASASTSVTLLGDILHAGQHAVVATATDSLGNSGSTTLTYSVAGF